MSDATQAEKATVEAELVEMREIADHTSVADLKGGGWFARLLTRSLNKYQEKVDAAYFREKYPNLPVDAVVDRRIALAKRYAAISGAMSAGAYTLAVAATIGSLGGASPLGLPAGVAAFAADLYFITQLQLKLAYDLSVLYEHPLDLDDPEDLYDLIQVAFGVKAGEALNNAALKLAPEATRLAVKSVARGSSLALMKSMPVVGKYLLQRNIIKFMIPAVGVPLSAGINYYTTGSIAEFARRVFRGRAKHRLIASDLVADADVDGLLTFEVVYFMIRSDGHVSAEEAHLLKHVSNLLAEMGVNEEELDRFRTMLDMDEAALFDRIRAAPEGSGVMLYEAAVQAAAADGVLHWEENEALKRLAEACGVEHDAKRIGEAVVSFR